MQTTKVLHGTMFSSVYTLFSDASGDEELINRMTLIATIYTVVVGIVSLVKPIAYGKFSGDGTMFTMNARTAWIVQEMPAFIVPLILIIRTPCINLMESNANKVALFCFVSHYFQRSFIYPYRVVNSKPVPIINCVMAFLFCSYNGLLQGLYLTRGTAIFFSGMAINIHSDGILIHLRKQSGGVEKAKSEYKIPRGGLFEYVSSANYFGEIVEWWGLFIVTIGMPQLIFAVFSSIFLGLRGVHRHQWYRKTFGRTYPISRKAIIPFVL